MKHKFIAFINNQLIAQLQNGPIGEVGENGAQIDDVILWCRNKIQEFDREIRDSHNIECIKLLDLALLQLQERRWKRTQSGVEGTSRA